MKLHFRFWKMRFWWRKSKKKVLHVSIWISIIFSFIMLLVVFINIGYRLDWTGFSQHVENISSGQQYQPAKTLWDWMQLLAAWLIPIAITIFSLRYTAEQTKTQSKLSTEEQEENAIQSYLDSMSELLLEKNLRASKLDDEVRSVARTKTLTVLSRVGGFRKGSVIQFLYESNLTNIIDLKKADLGGIILVDACLDDANLYEAYLDEADLIRADFNGAILTYAFLNKALLGTAAFVEADLRYAHLDDADLRDTFFHGADLSFASLHKADLSGADLSDADLISANLSEANLSEVDLSGADLSGADLSGADLNNANLSNTDLNGTKLHHKDINEIRLTERQIKSLKIIED